jgi:hypothetical protein
LFYLFLFLSESQPENLTFTKRQLFPSESASDNSDSKSRESLKRSISVEKGEGSKLDIPENQCSATFNLMSHL